MAKETRSFSLDKVVLDYLDRKAKENINVSKLVNQLIADHMIKEMEGTA